MAWVAVHKNGDEVIFDYEPERWNDSFWVEDIGDDIYLPKGGHGNVQFAEVILIEITMPH